MYDYATSTYQVRILSELQSINNNLGIIGTNIYYLLILISIIFLAYISYRLIIKCLGK